ncbi:hypothetical protein BC827DRAFT_1159241 [Russula dissimulans]|nr:hypothetical protein BC827DRAFT_1159241 [Russula dissimulans]
MSYLPLRTFPRVPSPTVLVQQIDTVPTLSLLLGLPIPFNNLGTISPELFWWVELAVIMLGHAVGRVRALGERNVWTTSLRGMIASWAQRPAPAPAPGANAKACDPLLAPLQSTANSAPTAWLRYRIVASGTPPLSLSLGAASVIRSQVLLKIGCCGAAHARPRAAPPSSLPPRSDGHEHAYAYAATTYYVDLRRTRIITRMDERTHCNRWHNALGARPPAPLGAPPVLPARSQARGNTKRKTRPSEDDHWCHAKKKNAGRGGSPAFFATGHQAVIASIRTSQYLGGLLPPQHRVAQTAFDILDDALAAVQLGALQLHLVDLALLVGLEFGVGHVIARISRLLALPAPSASARAQALQLQGSVGGGRKVIQPPPDQANVKISPATLPLATSLD